MRNPESYKSTKSPELEPQPQIGDQKKEFAVGDMVIILTLELRIAGRVVKVGTGVDYKQFVEDSFQDPNDGDSDFIDPDGIYYLVAFRRNFTSTKDSLEYFSAEELK